MKGVLFNWEQIHKNCSKSVVVQILNLLCLHVECTLHIHSTVSTLITFAKDFAHQLY
jgi:hypothetical protein